MKKAQMEMFGLVIIVVLIVVIALFALRFMFIGRGTSGNKDQVLSIKANNLINALLKVSVNGNDIKQDIGSCCVSNINCASIENKIEEIIENSIEENYEFTALSNDQECFVINKGQCEFGVSSSSYIDNIDGIKHEFSILLCK